MELPVLVADLRTEGVMHTKHTRDRYPGHCNWTSWVLKQARKRTTRYIAKGGVRK